METEKSKIGTFEFNEKYSYPYNAILKQYDGKFNKETKMWTLPLKNKARFLSAVQSVKTQQAEKAKLIWSKACEEVGVKFASKGTEDYDQVLAVFKEMIKTH
jgi:hypothetical protein